MTINKNILSKLYHDAAIESFQKELEKNGFTTKREYKIKNYRIDLFAEKGDEKIAFEFKIKRDNPKKIDHLIQLKKIINEIPNAKFKLIYINPPEDKEIEYHELEMILFDYLLEYPPDNFYDLATHVSIAGVHIYNINKIYLRENEIELFGNGEIDLHLQFGSNSDLRNDIGLEHEMSFSIAFHLYLDKCNNKIKHNSEIKIDID